MLISFYLLQIIILKWFKNKKWAKYEKKRKPNLTGWIRICWRRHEGRNASNRVNIKSVKNVKQIK